MGWCSLATHSQYSVLQSTIAASSLVAKAKSLGMKSVALTDSGNLYGAVDFYKKAKDAGIQGIIGSQLYLSFGPRTQKARQADRPNYSSIILLAKDSVGYKNLCKLSSLGYLEGFYYVPRIDKPLLFDHSKGLICISGALGSYHGYFASSRPQEELEWECQEFANVFGEDFYLQLQRMNMRREDIESDGMSEEPWLIQKYEQFELNQARVEKHILAASQSLSLPLVATHEAYYLERREWQAHEILLNIQSGEPCEIWQRDSMGNPVSRAKNPKRDTFASHEYYFKSVQEMEELFSDIPEALSNSEKIAQKCQFAFDFKTKHYPSFIPQGAQDLAKDSLELTRAVAEHLTKCCEHSLNKRYTAEKLKAVSAVMPSKDPEIVVKERLEMELDIIISKGLADYLLIVADFIQWAKAQGIPMGPGRGSGAGSIVCYLLGITDIEPLRFHLFFERFINPERISYPDIDVDICMDRRSEVIDYMLHKYGVENVAQIITFGTMKAKMSLKDVGRVLSVPLSKVNHICKVLPEDLNLKLESALEDVEIKALVESDEEVRILFDMAKILEGSIRNTGIHAAGMIVCADPLIEHIPLCSSKDAQMPVTQYSMKPVELVGMLKIDFLGLKTLTSIKKCVDEIKRIHGKELDWVDLPLDDKATFDLLNKGKTLGVFQLESGGMQDLARQLHLDKFEEIIAMVSLYRPGPMDMIPSYINRKHKREPIEYEHPSLEDILSETYGIMVYQEQVMQIASRLAGFSLAEGDVLRRAMGKKDAEEMARQRVKFLEGAQAKGIDPAVATSVFDKMEKFASYGFNKAHAAAYGYLAYVTAFLKSNYPKEWMAALMTCDCHDLTKVSKFIAEARAMGLAILAPDINESGLEFRASSKGIRFALSAIKGLGTAIVEHILEKRASKPFADFSDFLKRVDVKKLGKKSVELLIDAGAFDWTGHSRDVLLQVLEPLLADALRKQQDQARGVMTLFGLMDDDLTRIEVPKKAIKERTNLELLLKEKELLGFFVTGNPMHVYQRSLNQVAAIPLSHLNELKSDTVIRTAFFIDEVAVKVSQKTQKKFAILKISDGQERFELPVWSDLYEKHASILQENQLLIAVLGVEMTDTMRLSVRFLAPLNSLTPEDLQACDEAYDKAKSMLSNPRRQREYSGSSKRLESKKEVKSTSREITVVLDAHYLKCSHILKIKDLLQEHPGSDLLKLTFQGKAKRERTLVLDAKNKVNWSSELEDQLRQFLPILDCCS